MKLMSLVEEVWSDKYKESIDCNNPKGFSQKAHCAGKKKRNLSEVDLTNMIHTDKVKKKHKKEMKYGRTEGIFKDFDITKYTVFPPPKNESKKVKEELELLSSLPEEYDFSKKYDRIVPCFEKYIKEKGYDFSSELLEELVESAAGIILELKMHYNRPRPQKIAEKLNMSIGGIKLKSAKSPSYPSGHSAQSRLLGEYLHNETKDKEFLTIAEKISLSRNVARSHFVSDSKFGEKLGVDLYEYYKNKR